MIFAIPIIEKMSQEEEEQGEISPQTAGQFGLYLGTMILGGLGEIGKISPALDKALTWGGGLLGYGEMYQNSKKRA